MKRITRIALASILSALIVLSFASCQTSDAAAEAAEIVVAEPAPAPAEEVPPAPAEEGDGASVPPEPTPTDIPETSQPSG